MLGYYVRSEILFDMQLAINLGSLKTKTIPLCLRKPTAAPDSFPLSSGSEEKTVCERPGVPDKAWGTLWELLLSLGCGHELPLD